MNEVPSFDPERELNNIKHLPHDERREAIYDFKKELAQQRADSAILQYFMIEKVEQEPDIKQDELLKYLEATKKGLSISQEQLKIAKQLIKTYETRRRTMKRITKGADTPEEFYERIFRRKPLGNIEMIDGAVAYHFTLSNLREYAAVYKRKRPIEVTAEDMSAAEKTGGFFCNEKDFCTFEKASWRRPDQQNTTFIHEQMHAWHSLFKKELRHLNEYSINDDEIKKINQDKNPHHKYSMLLKVFRRRRRAIENRAQDELLAYNRNNDQRRTIGTLTKEKSESGLYDYVDQTEKKWIAKFTEKLDPAGRELVQEAFRQVFVKEYRSLIRQAQHAFELLISQQGGFDRQQAVHFLVYIPLSRWNIEVRRIVEAKNPMRD